MENTAGEVRFEISDLSTRFNAWTYSESWTNLFHLYFLSDLANWNYVPHLVGVFPQLGINIIQHKAKKYFYNSEELLNNFFSSRLLKVLFSPTECKLIL